MEVKIMRSETAPFRFIRTTEELPDDIFFTVKKDYRDRDFVLQKRLSDGGIVFDSEDGHYHFTILPEDTDSLEFGSYDFDLKIKDGINEEYLIPKSTLVILPVVTHLENEV